MSYIQNLLDNRKLPSLPADRAEAIGLLANSVYGVTPEFSGDVTGVVTKTETCCGGAGKREHIELTFGVPGGSFSFPFVLSTPTTSCDRPPRLAVFLNFRQDIPDKYYPEEMLMQNNFAVARVCYTDITSDGPEPDGLSAFFPREASNSVGKIGLWAFGASRVLDYCISLDRGYKGYGIIGHSRLGKTALWAGAQDERFEFVCSNCSGCSGAAITRDKQGEHVSDITRVFPFWFCPKYAEYADREAEMPIDQHMLLALIAPRKLHITSATSDTWADPESEYLSACAASPAWETAGVTGFVHPDRMALYEERFHEGNIGYYLREGSHALTERDWMAFIGFWNKRNPVW